MIDPQFLSQITLILGVDAVHLRELEFVWPDWMRHKPELRQMPALVFYDPSQVKLQQLEFLKEHPNLRSTPWELPVARNQREKMLSGFVHLPAREISTPWYLKLDTNTVATEPGNWLREEWFRPDEHGVLPAFIAPRWGYSKPRYAIDVLDDWADGVPDLAKFRRLNCRYTSESRRVRHRRIISWFFLGRTDWTRRIIPWLDPCGRLPIPSQDTLVSYCASRTKSRITRISMGGCGWEHRRLNRAIRVAAPERVCEPKPEAPVSTGVGDFAAAGALGPRGVIYFNMGTSCAVRMLVSLWSLRRFYQGPVTLISAGTESHPYCDRIAKSLDAEVREWEPQVPPGRNSTFLVKTQVYTATPYETSILIDSDTLIRGPIDQLFSWTEESGLIVTQMADWTVDRRCMVKRINSWKELYPEWVAACLKSGPAINGGVMAFRRGTPLLADWYRLALPGRNTFIPDETCLQLLLPRYPHRVVPHFWNTSCVYGKPRDKNTRIIHYHGRKHCRRGLPHHADLWTEAYSEVIRLDLAGVRSWQPAGDRMLKKYLHSTTNVAVVANPV